MREMKSSGVAWIGNIPKAWGLIRYKDKYKNSKEIAGDKSRSYERLALTLNGVIKRPKDDSDGLQPKEFDTYQVLHENDFVFKMIDLQNISTSRVGLSPYTGLVSPAYIRFCPKNKKQYPRFIYYFLMSMYYNCVFNNLGGDGVRSALNSSDMGMLLIPYPIEIEQHRIADYLDTACSKVNSLIVNQQTQIEKLKQYKQSLITEVVTKGLNPDVPMKDSGVEWVGQIPEGWGTIRVKQLLRERKERSTNGLEEPLSMSQKVGLIPTRMLDIISNMASSFVGAKLTYVDDLVFNKLKAHLGVFSVSKYDGLVSPDYAVYYSTGKASLKYLEYLFKTPQCISEFRKRSTGIAAGLTRLYTDGLFAIECPFPTINEQWQIVDYLDDKCAKIDRLIAIKQEKIDKLNDYKKSLIYEYVTGKKEA
jgi:type I restriction enzyme S subunit